MDLMAFVSTCGCMLCFWSVVVSTFGNNRSLVLGMAASRLCLVRARNDYAERQTKVSRCDADTCVIVAAGCRVKRRDNSLHDTMSIIGHGRHLYGSVEHIPRMDVPQEGYN